MYHVLTTTYITIQTVKKIKLQKYCKCITFCDIFFLATLTLMVVSIRQMKYMPKCAYS